MITSLKQVRLSSARYFIPGALLTSTILLYGLIYNGHIDSPTRYYEYLTAASPPPPPTGFTFHTPASDDPEFPRTVFDMQPGTWLSDHPPVNLLVREGYWIAQALVEAWNNQFTCRSGLRCITQWNEGHSTEGMDVVLTLSKDPGFRQIMDRDKTKLAFLGMEPYHYDVNVDETFDIKASVYQSEMSTTDFRWTAGPPDIRHVWTTYSEFPWASYLLPEALPNWDKLDKSRAVMFVSSNSCPQHRRDFIHELVKRGLDVWSFGTCASEHENTDRVAKLKELCEDGSLWQIPDWRKAKSCVSEHFKFIISIENSLHNDYVSEKFFHPFGIGTVPLYWGPRNIDVYAPGPNSYVNLRDYGVDTGAEGETPDYEGIIDLIDYYNNNDTAYEQFFDWKRNREFNPGFGEVNYRSWNNLACNLCEKSVEMDEKGILWGNARIQAVEEAKAKAKAEADAAVAEALANAEAEAAAAAAALAVAQEAMVKAQQEAEAAALAAAPPPPVAPVEPVPVEAEIATVAPVEPAALVEVQEEWED